MASLTCTKMNGYAHWLISKEFKEIKERQVHQQNIAQKLNDYDEKLQSLVLLHNGLNGEHFVKKLHEETIEHQITWK